MYSEIELFNENQFPGTKIRKISRMGYVHWQKNTLQFFSWNIRRETTFVKIPHFALAAFQNEDHFSLHLNFL